jgi:hypothetical protein
VRTQDITVEIDTAGMTELAEAPRPVRTALPLPRWPLRWQRHDGRTSLRWSAECLTRHYLVRWISGGGLLTVQTNPGRELITHLTGPHPSTDAAVDEAERLHREEG